MGFDQFILLEYVEYIILIHISCFKNLKNEIIENSTKI